VRINLLKYCLAFIFFLAGAQVFCVSAAEYPDHPIKVIIPFAGGGNADSVGRIIGTQIGESLGQGSVIENRPGVGGSLGAAAVAQSLPDGYTLLIGSNGPLTVNPFIVANLSYNSLTDFAPIAMVGTVPHAIMVNNQLPVKTLSELVAYSKNKSISTATSGVGSSTHLTLERLTASTGVKLIHVPYRGGNAYMADLIGGNVEAAVIEFSTALPIHNSGKARIIGIAALKRSPLAPSILTFSESGSKDFVAQSFVGVLAPAKTSLQIIDRLQKAVVISLNKSSTVQKLEVLGVEPAAPELQTPNGFLAYIKQDYRRSQEAANLAGLKPE